MGSKATQIQLESKISKQIYIHIEVHQHTQRGPEQESPEFSPPTRPHPGPYRKYEQEQVLEEKGS